jgi:uncharacterized protein
VGDHLYHHVIKDPVHHIMQWEHTAYKEIVKPIMDVPAFQRLRDVYQLGMTDKVFPGSTHTRFAHSLGTCYVASRIFTKIFQPLLYDKKITEEEYRLLEKYTLTTALFHDIGHGPFSHAFERFFGKKFDDEVKIDHEDWTQEFLYAEKGIIAEIFAAETMLTTEEHIANIYALISHAKHNYKLPGTLNRWMSLIGDIISSQLDADRMDYLLRDSHFCGVSYGLYDLEWLLNSIHYEETKDGYKIAVTRKGVGAVEHFLAARRLMTQNIYHHLKVKAEEEVMVALLIKLHADIFSENLDKNLHSFLKAVEAVKAMGLPPYEAKKKIIEDAFPFFREITDHDICAAIKNIVDNPRDEPLFQEALEQAEVVYHRGRWPAAWRLNSNRRGRQNLVEETREKLGLPEKEHWKLEIIEYPFKMLKTDRDSILVSDDYQTKLGTNIQELSEFAKQMGDRQEMIIFLSIHHELLGSKEIEELHKKLVEQQFFSLPPPLKPQKRNK